MKRHTIFFALLASLTITSGTRAQQQWHTIFPDRSDSSAFGYGIIAHGNTAIAVKINTISSNPNLYSYLESINDGTTWSAITSLPQGTNDLFGDFQMIDSLDGVATSEDGKQFLHTFDNWETWRVDTSIRARSHFGWREGFYL